jgi:hypothetical protein
LINKKEIFLGTALLYISGSFSHIAIQIGVFYPNYFNILINVTYTLAALGFLAYTYYWEKNLVDLKKVPTIIMGFTFILCIINIFSNILQILSVVFIIQILLIGGCFFLIFLVAQFTKNVKGYLRKMGFLLIFGLTLTFTAIITDHDPLIMMAPELFIILSPILFILGFLSYFATVGICEGITSYYNQAHLCTIHRGTIPKGEPMHYCSSCNTIYCQNCYEQVIKKDGCWNCGKVGKEILEIIPDEKVEDEELIIEYESKDTLEGNEVPKKKYT